MGNYAPALEGIGKLDGVQSVLLVSKEGEILEAISSFEEGSDFIPFALKSLESVLKIYPHYGKGEPGQQYIEFQDMFITLDRLGEDRYLILTGKSGMNLGRIRYEIKRSKKLLEEFKA